MMTLQPPPGFPICPEQQPSETIPEYAAELRPYPVDAVCTKRPDLWKREE